EVEIEVALGEIHVGPVLTRYEFSPAFQLRVEKLASVEEKIISDLAISGARVLSSVPGKPVMGIEIPNKTPRTVVLREILESEDWAAAKAALPIALGLGVGGGPIIVDLARMPHMLVSCNTLYFVLCYAAFRGQLRHGQPI
ncbi:MAG TPA: DNA translocase FtsK, partial [Candidatus Didemnitutus sp.]